MPTDLNLTPKFPGGSMITGKPANLRQEHRPMYLYLLKRKYREPHDMPRGFVIFAKNPKQAREVASKRAENNRKHDGEVWTDPAEASCTKLNPEMRRQPGIVLEDYLHG